MTEVIVEGTTDPYYFQLTDQGVPFVGTGFSVELVITTSTGAFVGSPAPTASWFTQATGVVVIAGMEFLPEGEYSVRYKVTDGIGNFGYFPNGETVDEWDVVQVVP